MTRQTFETGTIRQVHRHLTDTGYHVSEYAIRRWVKLGMIPAAYSGSTAYISAANVRRVLDNGTPTTNASCPPISAVPSYAAGGGIIL